MARWLLELHHLQHGAAISATTLYIGIGGLLVSLSATVLILNMCLLCFGSSSTQKQVGDKASSGSDENSPPPQLKKMMMGGLDRNINGEVQEVGEQQIRKSPPVWQRTILMGERCQRPSFSGLVLYDDKGNPLPRSVNVPKSFTKPT